MKPNRSEKEARLRKKAEQLIQDYLAWEDSHLQPNLTQIEDVILELRKELGQEMAHMLLEDQEERTPAPGRSAALRAESLDRSPKTALSPGLRNRSRGRCCRLDLEPGGRLLL